MTIIIRLGTIHLVPNPVTFCQWKFSTSTPNSTSSTVHVQILRYTVFNLFFSLIISFEILDIYIYINFFSFLFLFICIHLCANWCFHLPCSFRGARVVTEKGEQLLKPGASDFSILEDWPVKSVRSRILRNKDGLIRLLAENS